MNACWYYPLHLAAFAAGIAVLWWLKRCETPWPVRLAAGGILSVAMAAFMFRISEPPDLFSDFYKAYYPAARAVLSEESTTGLAETMQKGAGGFVNLPILAYLFAPFGTMPPDSAGWAFLYCGVAATVIAWFALSRLAGLDRDRALLLLFTVAACGPLHNSLREGNTTHFILLLLVAGLWELRGEREYTAGLIFGLAALIKLPLLLLGVYFFFRGRWRVAFGGGVACGLAAFASVKLFGWDLHVYWYEHSVKPFAETPLAAYNVQSVQGFFARVQHGTAYLTDWAPHAVHPVLSLASKGTVAFALAASAVAIFWPLRWRRNNTGSISASTIAELEFCVVMLLAMVVSTVSWSHYYLWVLLPAALVIGGRSAVFPLKWLHIPGWLALIGTLPPVLLIDTGHPLWNRIHAYFAVSHYLIAASLLLAVLLAAVWRIKAVAGTPREELAERGFHPARLPAVTAFDSEPPSG